MQKLYKRILIAILIGVITVALLFLFRKALEAVLLPIITSAIVAYFIIPLVNRFETRMKRAPAILLAYAIVFFGLAAVIKTIIPMLFQQIIEIINAFPSYLDKLFVYFDKLQTALKSYALPGDFERILVSQSDKLAQRVDGFLSGFTQGVFSFLSGISFLFFVPVISFYLIKDREKISEKSYFILPDRMRANVKKVMAEMNLELRKFISGQVTVAILVSLLFTLGSTFIGLKYALLLGVFMGVCNMIPFIGPLIGSVPILIAALTISPEKLVTAIIMILIAEQIDNMFITPRIIGNNIKAHPVTVMICVLAGSAMGGLFGMLLALPVFIMLRIIFKSIYTIIVDQKQKSL